MGGHYEHTKLYSSIVSREKMRGRSVRCVGACDIERRLCSTSPCGYVVFPCCFLIRIAGLEILYIMAALLHEQNQIALSIGERGGRFLYYRCAALAHIAGQQQRQPHHRGDEHRPQNSLNQQPTKKRPTSTKGHADDSNRLSVDASGIARSLQPPPPDIEAVALKPPGHAEPNFAAATVDATSGGIPAQAAPGHREECELCGRMFAADRISAHKKACAKANRGDRKAFNMQEHRVRQTYAGNYAEEDAARALRTANDQDDGQKLTALKSKRASWRQQSAALQNAMRSARGDGDNQQGFTIPIEEVDHRVECAGCGRRFAPETAETHIPKCIEKSRRGRR